MKAIGTDVCGKNFVVQAHAGVRLGIPDVVPQAIEQALGQGAWTEHDLATKWVSLETYAVVENALAKALGHPWRLVSVGHLSPETSFGKSEALEKNLIKSVLHPVTSPRLGVKAVPQATEAYVRNKEWHFVFDKPDRVILRLDYVEYEGVTRTEVEDMYSLLFYIRGIIESISRLWGPKAMKHYRVKYRTVNLRPEEIMTKVKALGLSPPTLHFKDGTLFAGTEECGRVVYLTRDAETDQYLGDGHYSLEAKPGTVPGVLITKDITAPCLVTGEELPLLRAGEVYRHSVRLPNLVEIVWKSSWYRRLVDYLLLRKKGLHRDLAQESRLADAERRAESATAKLSESTAYIRRTVPSDLIARQMAQARLEPFSADIVVVQFDIVGYTQKTEGWSAARKAQIVGGLLKELLGLGVRNGGYDYKTVGDNGVLIFNVEGWPRDSDEPNPFPNLQKVARAAIITAVQMQKLAARRGFPIRIGIHIGPSTWYDISTASLDAADVSHFEIAPRLEANGQAFDLAARLEASTEADSIAASQEVMLAAFGSNFLTSDSNAIRLGFHDAGDVEIKGGHHIHAWIRRSAGQLPPFRRLAVVR